MKRKSGGENRNLARHWRESYPLRENPERSQCAGREEEMAWAGRMKYRGIAALAKMGEENLLVLKAPLVWR